MLSQYPYAIVLASGSPRRLELLRQIGLRPIVEPADVDETLDSGLTLVEALVSLADRKAEHVAKRYTANIRHFAPIVIGADTIVVLDDKIIGKPNSAESASATLQMLSGRTHKVLTGVSIIDTSDGSTYETLSVTNVKIRELSAAEIADYVDSGEAFDKAGAYAIQGQAAVFIEEIRGDYTNVVGLPIANVYQVLRRIAEGR